MFIYGQGPIQLRRNLSIILGQLFALGLILSSGFFESSGWSSFSRDWWISSGFGTLFLVLTENKTGYLLYWKAIYLTTLISIGVFKKKGSLMALIFVAFTSLLFLSPVYNPWYCIWYFIPAFFLKDSKVRFFGLSYAVLSCLSLLQFSSFAREDEFQNALSLFMHLPFFGLILTSLFLSWKYLETNRKKGISLKQILF